MIDQFLVYGNRVNCFNKVNLALETALNTNIYNALMRITLLIFPVGLYS